MTTGNSAKTRLNRRRFLSIAAATAVAGGLPASVLRAEPAALTWRGVALGANASLTLSHPDPALARAALADCLAEVARLEAIFSLHRADSALVRLNHAGRLDDAPADLRLLLAEALGLSEATRGAFDPTVQPLWALLAGARESDLTADAIAAAQAKIGWRNVHLDDAVVSFAKPGMAVTLNGIAQGYITDRVGALLCARGFVHVLVNMGEQLALGPKANGHPWTIGIADPHRPGHWIETVERTSGAVATSGVVGGVAMGSLGSAHLLDPRTGRVATDLESVTVVADRAVLADALSTAFAVSPVDALPALKAAHAKAYVVRAGAATGSWI